MNPDIPRHGRSFRAAWLYYFHDQRLPCERERFTEERVAFTATHNLPTNDPEKGWKWMAHTALHQQQIKRAAGGDLRGRKMERPLYAYSLNWHPSENPSPEQMFAAAQDSLERMGLTGHEALFAAHQDREHRHIHVLVNKVHPETGRGPDLSNDYHRLQQWAYDYERRRGKIYCRRREFNIISRDAKTRVEPCARIELSFNLQTSSSAAPDRSRQQRAALAREKKAKVEKALTEIRERLRTEWRRLEHRQRREIAEIQAAKSAWQRLGYWLKNRRLTDRENTDQDRRGFLVQAFEAVCGASSLRQALGRLHQRERRRLVDLHRTAARGAVGRIRNEYESRLSEGGDRSSLRSVSDKSPT